MVLYRQTGPASFTLNNNIPENDVLMLYIFIPEEEQKLIPYKDVLFIVL